jgi:hypothetical protein
LILSRSSNLGLDCNAVLKEVFTKFNGKRGKPEFASGIINKDNLGEALEFIKSKNLKFLSNFGICNLRNGLDSTK